MANFTLDQTGQEIQDILDTVGNNEATQGQVLTADGNGGASWQNASGGSLYRHSVYIGNATDSAPIITIFNHSSNSLTLTDVAKYLYDSGYDASYTNHLYRNLTNQFFFSTSNNHIVKRNIFSADRIDVSVLAVTYTFTINGTNVEINVSSVTEVATNITDFIEQI